MEEELEIELEEEREFVHCCNCDKLILVEDAEDFDEKPWCEDCLRVETTICDDCGERVYISNTVSVNDGQGIVCESCRDENYYFCSDCHEWYDKDSMTYISNCDDFVCEDCLDNGEYAQCEYCNEWFYYGNGDGTRLHNGDWYCNDHNDEIGYCAECEEAFFYDDMHYSERNDDYYCDRCYREGGNDMINGYHDCCDSFKLLGDDSELRFGLELEVRIDERVGWDALCNDARKVRELMGEIIYDIQEDGSVSNGYEIITNPMTKKYFDDNKDKIKEALDYLKDKGYQEYGDNCGVHIHFTKSVVKDKNPSYYEDLNFILETFSSKVQDIARRRTIYGGYSNGYKGDACKEKGKVSYTKLSKMLDKSNRYQLINLLPVNTFEWRIFKGTTVFDTLEEYVTMAYGITSHVMNNSFVGKTFSELTGLKDDDKTRLTGIAREKRYAKLIQDEMDRLYKRMFDFVKEKLDGIEPLVDSHVYRPFDIKVKTLNVEYSQVVGVLDKLIQTYHNAHNVNDIKQAVDGMSTPYGLNIKGTLREYVAESKTIIDDLISKRDNVVIIEKKELPYNKHVKVKSLDIIRKINTGLGLNFNEQKLSRLADKTFFTSSTSWDYITKDNQHVTMLCINFCGDDIPLPFVTVVD